LILGLAENPACFAYARDQFLDAAAAPHGELAPVGPQDFERWIGPLARRWPLVVFLDYDGTLAEIAPHPTLARSRGCRPRCATPSRPALRAPSDRGIAGPTALTPMHRHRCSLLERADRRDGWRTPLGRGMAVR
jgi:hypothetical protein